MAKVFVDGALVATIDTAAADTAERYVAFAKSWSKYARHTIRIVVVGGRVDLDAFGLLG